MNASRHLERQLLNHFFRGQNIPSPSLYAALYISDPTDDDTGTEIQGGGYVRQPVSFSAPAVSGGKTQITNSITVEFPIATADWGTVSHWGIRTALTGGDLLVHAAVAVPKLIEQEDQLKFNIGTMTIDAD